MAWILVAFTSVLLVNGFTHGAFLIDGRVASSGPSDRVPSSVLDGGPIITTDGATSSSVSVPDKTIVLTFDDGPDPEWTPQVLDVLREYRVPATFFVVGSLAARHPELVERVVDEGGELGVHTFSHPDLALQSEWRRKREIEATQLAIAGAAGVTSALVRPPYSSQAGAVDDAAWPTIQELGAEGYATVLASQDSKDWQRPGVDAIVRNSLPGNGAGEVLLLHDAGGDRSQTVAALRRLIPQLLAEGYTFSTVSGVLGKRTNTEATASSKWQGRALVAAVVAADALVRTLAVLLYAVGALIIARLLLMVVLARRHARRRRSGRFPSGPPVTEPVSVIVPAYNEKEIIAETIRSLRASDHPIEIIVVDDGSTDGTAGIVAALGHDDVRVIRKSNGGKPSALNAGVAHARHELIVMMDGDTVFEPGTVRHLVQPFADPRVGAVAGNAKVANRRGLLGWFQHIEYVSGSTIDRRVYDTLGCMPTVPGAVGAWRRRALLQAGGVSDETLAEDTDLTMAVCRAGWRVVYEDRARAWTEVPRTLNQLWRQRYRWSYGTMQSMWKHRRALVERGPSGRLGRRGLLNLAVFQILLPLLAPLVDVFLVYGILVVDPVKTVLAWLAVMALQAAVTGYAFRLDGEPLRPLWRLPLQQFVYRQLMYLVVVQSMLTALGGVRLRWHKLDRTGGLNEMIPGSRIGPAAE